MKVFPWTRARMVYLNCILVNDGFYLKDLAPSSRQPIPQQSIRHSTLRWDFVVNPWYQLWVAQLLSSCASSTAGLALRNLKWQNVPLWLHWFWCPVNRITFIFSAKYLLLIVDNPLSNIKSARIQGLRQCLFTTVRKNHFSCFRPGRDSSSFETREQTLLIIS